ncbi:MAG: tetratricopeptide repeat protein [Myxococcaceae bacterium]
MLTVTLALALAQAAPPAGSPDADALRRTVAVESANIEKAPDDTDALYRLGLAHLSLGEAKKAIKPLEQLVKTDPESIDGKLLLARAYRGAGEIDKARTLLDQAMLALPDDSSLVAERGQLSRSTEDFPGAVKFYKKAVELAPEDVELLFNLGEAQQSNHNIDDSIATYRKVLAAKGDFTQARVNLGKALAEKGLFGEAKEMLSAASKDSLADSEAHYNLGVIYMREGAISQATTEFERTLAINPKHAQALNNLGVAWDARADTKKALDYFKRAAAADPTFAEPCFNQGMSYMKLNQPQQATKAFEQALKLEPDSAGPYVQLGTLYLKQGKKDRALEAFKKAIASAEEEEKKAGGFLQLRKLNDTRRTSDAYRGLALTYLAMGKTDDAVGVLKTVVSRMPKDASARLALGDAYLAQNNFDGAIEQFTERLALEPTTDARLDLARAYSRKRVAKQAEPLYREVLKAEPDNRGARMGLVDLFISMGRYPDAEDQIKEALKKDENDLQALARLGILKSRMGRPDQALEPLEKVATQNPLLFDARAEYAFLLFRGDPTNADKCINTMADILTSEPRHVLSLHYMGMCQYAKGNKQRAEEAFKGALAVDPNFSAALFSLGELYESDGKKDEAKKSYEAAANLNHPEAREALKKLK